MNPFEEAVLYETRRQFFSRTARGLGVAALASMFGRDMTLSAAGLAPLNAPDSRLGQLVFLVVAFAFAIAFADASRSVAAEVRARGEDPDPPPTRPG